MKKQGNLYRSVLWVAAATALILMAPLAAMQFTSEVDWSAGDFIIMGALIFGTGLAYVLLTRAAPGFAYRAAVALALGTTFLMIWANLAVGLIGSGPHAGNFMYMAVVSVVLIGTILARFQAARMERVMYAATLTLVLLAVIAFLAGMHRYPASSAAEILSVSGVFSALYLVAGSLFRYTASREALPKQPSA